jgi:hypothetical protein
MTKSETLKKNMADNENTNTRGPGFLDLPRGIHCPFPLSPLSSTKTNAELRDIVYSYLVPDGKVSLRPFQPRLDPTIDSTFQLTQVNQLIRQELAPMYWTGTIPCVHENDFAAFTTAFALPELGPVRGLVSGVGVWTTHSSSTDILPWLQFLRSTRGREVKLHCAYSDDCLDHTFLRLTGYHMDVYRISRWEEMLDRIALKVLMSDTSSGWRFRIVVNDKRSGG